MAFGVQFQPLNIAALDQSALQSTALDREMREQNALAKFLDMNGAGLASPNVAKREGVLSQMLGMGPRAMQFALPQINAARQERQRQDMLRGLLPGVFGAGAQPAPQAASVGSVPVPGNAGARMEQWRPIIAREAQRTGVDPALLERLIMQESGGRPDARGGVGEVGLGQIRPSTARAPGFGVAPVNPAELANPERNIAFTADYLAGLIRANGGDVQRALMAYNGGQGNVQRGTVPPAAQQYAQIVGGGGAPAAAPAQGGVRGLANLGREDVARIAAVAAATGDASLAQLAGTLGRLVEPEDRELVQVDTPQGPRLVPRSQAVNAAPGGTAARGENELRDEFTKLTQNFRIVQDAYQGIRSAEPTGAGDMKLLYMYVKLLDPTSVVRESEFATAAASGSFGERVQGLVQRVISGQRLPESLRADFLREAESLYRVNLNTYNQVQQAYTGIARQRGLNPANVFPDLRQPVPPAPARAAQAGPTAGAASAPAVLPPTPGEVRDGYQFRGGNPRDQSNWVPVGPVSP